ncbi:unnamed protein product [Cuscuta epithymum]|uniref:Uncharacterized protein n=1 Tax=Cuscuta epithymum TaxID=186058 RepID=A0AAV0F0J5_9ASTE|nr:unnamed protein product [Cuscuta epithymum]CAH9129033.1 unnamed protein product [Cuscuta epithymum]
MHVWESNVHGYDDDNMKDACEGPGTCHNKLRSGAREDHATSQPERESHVYLTDTTHDQDGAITHDIAPHTNDTTQIRRAISMTKEPNSFGEAIRDPQWRGAMSHKIRALERTCTWQL